MIDPAGFVKGWATELAVKCLDRGWISTVVRVGRWRRPDTWHRRRWIAVEGRDSRSQQRRRVPFERWSKSSTRRGNLGDSGSRPAPGDGRTDRPASARVDDRGRPHLTWADAFATSGVRDGPRRIDWVSRFDGYRALAITRMESCIRRDEQWAHASMREAVGPQGSSTRVPRGGSPRVAPSGLPRPRVPPAIALRTDTNGRRRSSRRSRNRASASTGRCRQPGRTRNSSVATTHTTCRPGSSPRFSQHPVR